MADTTIANLPDGVTANGSDRLPVERSPFGAGTNFYITPGYVLTYLVANGVLVSGGALGTPSSGSAANLTGLPISTGITGLGTGIATALAVNVGTDGAPVVKGGALGTPSSGNAINMTGAGDLFTSLRVAPVAVTNPAATTLTVNALNVITATSACSMKLPACAAGNRMIGVVLTNASTNLFTLNPSGGGDKIQPGANTSRVMWKGESALLWDNGTDWVKLDGLSYPMIGSLYRGSGNQGGLSDQVFTTILIDTLLKDNTGQMVDTANNRLIIRRTGAYIIGSGVQWSNLTTTISRMQVGFNVNGVGSGSVETNGASGAYPVEAGVNPGYPLTAADLITMFVYQNSGTNQTIIGNANALLSCTEIPAW